MTIKYAFFAAAFSPLFAVISIDYASADEPDYNTALEFLKSYCDDHSTEFTTYDSTQGELSGFTRYAFSIGSLSIQNSNGKLQVPLTRNQSEHFSGGDLFASHEFTGVVEVPLAEVTVRHWAYNSKHENDSVNRVENEIGFICETGECIARTGDTSVETFDFVCDKPENAVRALRRLQSFFQNDDPFSR